MPRPARGFDGEGGDVGFGERARAVGRAVVDDDCRPVAARLAQHPAQAKRLGSCTGITPSTLTTGKSKPAALERCADGAARGYPATQSLALVLVDSRNAGKSMPVMRRTYVLLIGGNGDVSTT